MPATLSDSRAEGAIPIELAVAAFWAGLSVPLVSYLIYPALVVGLAKGRRPPVVARTATAYPSVTVAIAAHNEEATIERVVRSILEPPYPGSLRVIVGLDGCTDRTGQVLATIDDPRLTVLELPRGGKASTDNALVSSTDSDIVVTTSAGAEFSPITLTRLVEPFADPTVGCVTGIFRPRRGESEAAAGEGLYWRFEYLVHRAESDLGILAMASGTALAFRRHLFESIPADSDADVTVAPSTTAQGYRVVHAPDAIVFDDGPTSLAAVLRNRRRMALRALPATIRFVPRLVRAGRPGAAAALIAHKLFRWLTPAALCITAVAAIALVLAGDAIHTILVAAGIAGVTVILAAAVLAGPGPRGALASLAIAQVAFALATVDALVGRRARTWTRG